MSNDRPKDTVGSAWDDFREEGPADIRAALKWCQQQAPTYKENAESLEEQGRQEQAKIMKRTARAMLRRQDGLEMLLNWISVRGPKDVPTWEQLTGEQKTELGGTDAPHNAKVLVEVYNEHRDDISQIQDLDTLARKQYADGASWEGKRKTLRDRLNDRGIEWEHRDVESFIRALARMEDVDATFGDSEEG
jgi:hypothetical protein